MATTGSQADILARLKAVLPAGWFPLTPSSTSPSSFSSDFSNDFGGSSTVAQASATPILDGVLSGVAWGLSYAYSLLQYVQLQQRIATATDVFLDLAALDYFGGNLTRNNDETDAVFSERIRASLLPPAATRAAISTALTTLTGREPIIFEPWNTGDTGGYGTGEALSWSGLAYNTAGGYGSLMLPAQAFITAYRQIEGGIANVAGYSGQTVFPAPMVFLTNTGAPVTTGTGADLAFLVGQVYAPGGYGVGAIEYVSAEMSGTQVQDAQIFFTVAATQAAGVTCWTKISN